MAQYKVPRFLSRLGQDLKKKLMEEYVSVASTDVMEHYIEFLEKELAKLSAEEEKVTPETAFEMAYKLAHNRGKREMLRKIISDLKKVDHA